MIHTKDIRNRDSLRNTKNVLESLNLMLTGETPVAKQKPINLSGDNSQHTANSFFFQYFKRLVFISSDWNVFYYYSYRKMID